MLSAAKRARHTIGSYIETVEEQEEPQPEQGGAGPHLLLRGRPKRWGRKDKVQAQNNSVTYLLNSRGETKTQKADVCPSTFTVAEASRGHWSPARDLGTRAGV